MLSPVHAEPVAAFQPVVVATLEPATTTTTTSPPTSTATTTIVPVATAVAVATSLSDAPEPDDPPAADTEPVFGMITADAFGTQQLAASLEDGARVQAGTGCALLISGHRTTAIAPFRRIDELAVGDTVAVTRSDGTDCRFAVAKIELLDETTAFRRVNLFGINDAALYACADATGGPGGVTHRWWVTLALA
jgi:hypothetical protein